MFLIALAFLEFIFQRWNKRWFVLNSTGTLDYFHYNEQEVRKSIFSWLKFTTQLHLVETCNLSE